MSLLRTLFTEDDGNRVFSLVHVIGGLFSGSMVGGQIWHTVTTGAFDAQSFGIGAGALVAGIAGAIYGNAKAPSVPAPPTPRPPPDAKPPGQTP